MITTSFYSVRSYHFIIISIIHNQEGGLNAQINSGRKSHKKFLQKLLIITLIYPCERWHPNYPTYINFTIKPYQILFKNKIFYMTQ